MPPDLGARLRAARHAQGRTQTVLAGLAGLSADYLAEIERGRRTPSVDTLVALASALDVHPGALLDPVPASRPQTPPADRPVSPLARVLLTPPTSDGEPEPPGELRRRTAAAWQIWQTSPHRYTTLAPLLPGLLRDTEHTLHATDTTTERRTAHRAAADLYGLTRSYLRRTGEPDLALLAADRAAHAAKQADDPVRIAAGAWSFAHARLRTAPAEAEDIARRATDTLRTTVPVPSRAARAMTGALLLVTAVASGHRWRASADLETASRIADRTGEANVAGTAFGPANVAVHRVAVARAAGDAETALRAAGCVATAPLRERHVQLTLDRARCADQLDRYQDALAHLTELARVGPEEAIRNNTALAILDDLRHCPRPAVRRAADALADRLGL